MPILVDASKVAVSRSDRVLFSDLSVTVTDRDRLGVVGINGTGKSTLLRVLAGVQTPEEGEVHRGRSVRIGLLDQEADLPAGTVRQAVGDGWESEAILDRLDMTPFIDRDVSDLSGGQAKRVALARVLSNPAELLILDEPTNHLDLSAIAWLEAWLARFSGGVMLVSHDRYLLDRVTTRMVELDRGHAYVHNGGYAGYLLAKADRQTKAEGAEEVRQNLARRELAWLRRGARARTRKPQARIDAARKTIESRPEAQARETPLEMGFETPRLGSKVLEVETVSFSYPGAALPTLSEVSLSIDPRERLGVVGLNGSGKSTLLEILAGEKLQSSGSIDRGLTVKIGYFTQQGPDLDPSARVREVVAGPLRAPGDLVDQRLMERFWFTGELPWATVGTLSGGERRRLQLLTVLASRPNVLLLDEPTNDLDLDTLRALEDFLEDWPGALVTVSHDRTFLERVTDRIVACRSGRVSGVVGGLQAWIAETTAHESVRPGRSSAVVTGSKSTTKDALGKRRRSSSTLANELRKLDKELVRLTADRDRLVEAFSSAEGHQELGQLGVELAEVQGQLDSAEEQWLALAEEADEVG